MTLQEITSKIDNFLARVEEKYTEALFMKNKKNVDGRFIQLITSKLQAILGNIELNPIMKYDEATNYYFDENLGMKRLQEKYQLILDLQDYICDRTMLPFVYDKYTILKILQLTLTTYNDIIEEAKSKQSARDEDINNLFLDIDTMLLNARNTSAENGTKNAKAIDTTNKYQSEFGGYGVKTAQDNSNGGAKKEILVCSVESVNKKLHSFGFSGLLEAQAKTQKEEGKK